WKAGIDFLHTQDFIRYLRNRNGTYEYGDFTSFALDFSGNTSGARRWQAYSQRFGNEVFDQSIRDYSLFTEDQFRVSSRVTLHYGLRYEYASLPQPGQVNPDYPGSGRIPSVKTNLAPRFGMAVAFNRARSVVRAGYGIFYARYQTGLISTFFQENGIDQQSMKLEKRFLSDLQAGPVFPNRLPTLAPSGAIDPAAVSSIDLTLPSGDYRNPYTHQADLAIEHAISAHLNLSVSWLSSRALHLTTVRDLNIGRAGSPVTYDITDAQGKTVGQYITPGYRLVNRVNPKWRRVNSVESGGNSYYNALVVQLRKRFSRQFEGFVAYTWSHAIDFNQGGGADNIFFSDGPRTLSNGDYRGEKASSQLDQRHRLVAGSTWEPRLTEKNTAIARWAVNGWRLSQITTCASTQPATPTILVSGVPFPGAAFNSTVNGFGGSTRVPFYPASSLPIDQVIRTDARLTKILPLTDRHQLHINFEAFNLFNHVSSTAISALAFEASGGVLRPMPHLGEGVASQGYPDGTNARRAQVSARFIW
ncbi:MAG: TonB-dependent receptor, partial [Candidatus Solibacter sp.]|nr:TonB-dependent receptor [Candidatus Solibacter sp.]